MEGGKSKWSMGGGSDKGARLLLPPQMWMSAPRAQAYVAAGSARTCRALSAVFARLVSGARRVKRMWMSVPRSHHPAGQAAVTTRLAPFTVPALLASAPEDRGPPAKVRVLGPTLRHRDFLWVLERHYWEWWGARGLQRGLVSGTVTKARGTHSSLLPFLQNASTPIPSPFVCGDPEEREGNMRDVKS
jgi:hypothetical protein